MAPRAGLPANSGFNGLQASKSHAASAWYQCLTRRLARLWVSHERWTTTTRSRSRTPYGVTDRAESFSSYAASSLNLAAISRHRLQVIA
jgi:hypothetical protein